MTPADLRVDDEVVLTGVSSSPDEERWENAWGTVSTVSNDGLYVKLWMGPDVEKVWFEMARIESVRMVNPQALVPETRGEFK